MYDECLAFGQVYCSAGYWRAEWFLGPRYTGRAACSSMTIRMHVRRKGCPLEYTSVDVIHGKIHGEDCEHCETKDGKIDQFQRKITLKGGLDQDQRARL